MIVTLTANPSLDRTITLGASLRPGEVQQATGVREDAGGKGINVARVVAAADEPTLAVLPLAVDDPFGAVLSGTGLAAQSVRIDGHARANLTIADPEGVTTKLNLPGARFDDDSRAAVVAAVVEACADADWLVLAGSLPPGAGEGFYVDVIEAVRARYADRAPRFAVDTSGPALTATVERGLPDLIKPNDEELADLAGVALEAGAELADAVLDVARRLVPSKAAAALVTLGAHGAVLVTADAAWVATPPRIQVLSTVGAGDSSLAGFLIADVRGADAADRLVNAVRYGAAAASLPGTQAPTPADLPTGDIPVRQLASV